MRILDIVISSLTLVLLSPVFILILILGILDTGYPLYFQKRVGLNQKFFTLIKFRTMKINTLSVGTHLVDLSNITYLGHFLRKFKLDELPQLINVLIGDMSLVGPRPCLPNQRKLINKRKKKNIFKVKPGLTGLAQVTGINMSTPELLVKIDLKMIKMMNLYYYFYYILFTVLLIFKKDYKY